jgi:hypothetical protein
MPARPNLSYDQNGNAYEGGPMKIMNTNVSVAISTTATFLHTVNITKAGSAWNLKLYDGLDATGTLVWDQDCNAVGGFQVYGECKVGLYAVTSGTTAGALTISYSDELTY